MNFFKGLISMFKLEDDKRHHAVYSFAICITLCLLLSFLKSAPLIAVLASIAIGVGKEIYDMKSPIHQAEWKDLSADGVGIILAVLVFYISTVLS